MKHPATWSTLICIIVVLGGCASAKPDRVTTGTVPSTDTTRPDTCSATGPRPLGGADEATFPTFRTLNELAQVASEVIVAVPIDDSRPEIVGSKRLTDNAVDQYYGKMFDVREVLVGTAIGPGDQIEVAFSTPHVEISDSRTGTTVVESGGAGYAAELCSGTYIFGLAKDPVVVAEGDPWAIVASAHGLIGFDTQDDRLVAAEPRPGQDGLMQQTFAGRTIEDVIKTKDEPIN